jgi:hypothetical protein
MKKLLPALPPLVATILVVLIVLPVSANAPLAKPVRGNTYTLSPDNHKASLWIPLEMDAGINLTTVEEEVEVIDFSRKGQSSPAIRGALTSARFENPEDAPPRLEIEVELKPLIPETYNLRVRLDFTHTAEDKPASKFEMIDLVLVYKAGKLHQPSPLFVRRTDGFLGFPSKKDANKLELELATLDTELHEWEIDPIGVTGPDGEPLSSGIAVTPEPLLDRKRAPLPFDLEGSFPLGRSKGKIRIKSDELETPTEVAFEVVRTRSKGWICVVLSFGLVLGYLLRVVNANLELLNERDDTKRKLVELHDASKDSVFKQMITEARTKLENAGLTYISREPARLAMRTAIDTALAELKKAQEDFVKRRAEEQGKLDTFAKLVGTNYEPVPEVARELTTARASYTSAREQFELGNVVEAKRLRTEAEGKLGRDATSHLAAFVSTATETGGRKGMVDIAGGVLAYVVKIEPVKTARTAWNNALKPVVPGTETKSVLKAAHDLWRAETNFAGKLGHHLVRFLGLAIKAVGSDHSTPLVVLRQRIENDTKGKQPDEVTSAIVEIEDLTATVDDALIEAVNDAHQDALDQALSEGKYDTALTIVQLPAPPKAAPLGAGMQDLLCRPGEWGEGIAMVHYAAAGGEGHHAGVWQQVQLAQLPGDDYEELGDGPAEPPLIPGLVAPGQPASDVVIRRAATQVLGLLAWLLSFAVLFITGYVTFQKGYVGKWPEFIPIFLWAFGLDMGVNTMLAKGLKKT